MFILYAACEKQCCIYQKEVVQPDKAKVALVTAPVKFALGSKNVTVEKAKIMLDSGANLVVVSPKLGERLIETLQPETSEFMVLTAGGVARMRAITAPVHICLAESCCAAVDKIMISPAGLSTDGAVDVLIGTNFMRQAGSVLDFKSLEFACGVSRFRLQGTRDH
jgi:hypothetical protein